MNRLVTAKHPKVQYSCLLMFRKIEIFSKTEDEMFQLIPPLTNVLKKSNVSVVMQQIINLLR